MREALPRGYAADHPQDEGQGMGRGCLAGIPHRNHGDGDDFDLVAEGGILPVCADFPSHFSHGGPHRHGDHPTAGRRGCAAERGLDSTPLIWLHTLTGFSRLRQRIEAEAHKVGMSPQMVDAMLHDHLLSRGLLGGVAIAAFSVVLLLLRRLIASYGGDGLLPVSLSLCLSVSVIALAALNFNLTRRYFAAKRGDDALEDAACGDVQKE